MTTTPSESGAKKRSVIIAVPISIGELFDKISILEIKAEKITDPGKLENIRLELAELNQVVRAETLFAGGLDALCGQLKAVNEKLWVVEDDIRALEAKAQFDSAFIALARSVYQLNDERARLKRDISFLMGSTVVEEKSYHPTS